MCATCGCGIDLGSLETVFAKKYLCIDCGKIFQGFGYKPECTNCHSRNTEKAK